MHIKSVEALKSWLTTRLESVCDADPAALAKYVVALVKKDKPVQELRDICVDQLEVFLSDETSAFVNMLFDALTSYSYLPQPHLEASSVLAVPTPTPSVPTPLPNPVTSTSQDKPRKPSFSEDVLTTRVLAEPDDDDRDFKRTRRTTDTSDRSSTGASSGVSPSGEKSRKRRAEDDGSRIEFSKVPKDEVSQIRRVDSQTKDELNQRNKSDAGPYDSVTYPIPSAMHRDRGGKHFDNQDGSGRSSGSNSHEEMSGRRGSPPWERRSDRMGRGGRSYRDRYREERSRHGGRDERERGGLRRSRCRDYDEKGFCMRGELCPYDHGNDPVVVQDVIPGILGMTGPPFLPDVRPIPGTALPGTAGPVPGSYPPSTSQPPPPGTTGTIPTSTPKSNQNQEGPKTSVPVSGPHPSAPSRIVPLEHSHPPVLPPHPVHMLQRPMLTTQVPRPPFNNPFEDSYNPEQPQFDRGPVWMRLGNGRPPHPIAPHAVFHPAVNVRSRELLAVTPNQPQLTVQVPGLPTQGQRMPIVPERTVIHADAQNQSQKQQPSQQQAPVVTQQPPVVTQQPTLQPNAALNHSVSVKSRLGYPRKLSDTLELKKIPQDMNKIAKLNEHFQRFGTITNIQVCAFGNPEAALIQFSQHREAKAAYSCPDAVFGNRFIRVFWYNPERQQHDNKDGGSTTVPTENKINVGSTTPEVSVKEISNKPETKPKPTMFQSGKTTFLKTGKPLLGHAHNTPGLTKKQQEQQKQEAVKKKLEIQKQKQELLNKQIQEQKNLISKLEKKNLNPAEKELILKTIKSLSSNIEALKKEVELAAMAAKSKESPSQARQIAQRAILDQELDLISHQNTGEDTTELKKKVEELKQEAKSLGLLDPPGRGRGRGVTRGRGRGLTLRGRPFPRTTRVWTRESAALDHRPKQITVSDITPEQREDITEHFKEFGIVDSVEYIEDKNSLNVAFRTRREAEIAYGTGKTYKGRALKISWYRAPGPPPSPAALVTSPTTPTVLKKVEEELGLDLDAELRKLEDDPDAEEVLLLGEDFDEEEEEEDERSWKR